MNKFFKDLLTENDGQSYDLVRVAIFLVVSMGIPTLVWGAVYSTIHPDHHFDLQGFGIALGSLLGGICAAAVGVGQKQKTDTPVVPEPPAGQ
jgi:hypothetical protein